MRVFCMMMLVVATAFAADPEANIRQGNAEVAGSIFMNQALSGNSGSQVNSLSTYVNVGYFVADYWSIGGIFSFEGETGTNSTITMGPKASYFFWRQGKMAAYGEVAYHFGLTGGVLPGQLNVALGYSFFPVPAVAFGPWVSYRRYFPPSGGRTDVDRLVLGAGFGIFL